MAFHDFKDIFSAYYGLVDNRRPETSYERTLKENELDQHKRRLNENFTGGTTKICCHVFDFSGSYSKFDIRCYTIKFYQNIWGLFSKSTEVITLDFRLTTSDENEIKTNLKNVDKNCNITGRIASIEAKIYKDDFEDKPLRLKLRIYLDDCTISYASENWLTKGYLNIPDTIDDFVQQRRNLEEERERNIRKRRSEEEKKAREERKEKFEKNLKIFLGVSAIIIALWIFFPHFMGTIATIILILFILSLFTS